MVLKINKYLVIQILILKVLTTAAQHSIKQYLHVTGVGPHAHSAGLTNLPTVGLAPRQAVPNTGLAALSALALPALISSLSTATTQQQQPIPQAIPQTALVPTLKTQPTTPPVAPTSKTNSPATNTQGLDSNVLNNLAIALQLLIVSNILNSNLPENEANPIYEMLETVKNIPVSLSPSTNSNQGLETTPSFLTNAQFMGSSGFTGTSGATDPYTKPNSRNNYALMSPYEALGPNSPYSDPILASPYGSVMSSKKDFHSPYAMMDSDLFSVSDVF